MKKACKGFFTKTLLKTQVSGLIRDKLMEKLFTGLYIIIITLSFACGFLLLYTNDLQSQNNTLESQTSGYQNQIKQLEGQIEELEDQITELEKQIEDLEEQIFLKRKAE
jgi:peptidoglycan hydrolase CwlO-like protein